MRVGFRGQHDAHCSIFRALLLFRLPFCYLRACQRINSIFRVRLRRRWYLRKGMDGGARCLQVELRHVPCIHWTVDGDRSGTVVAAVCSAVGNSVRSRQS